MVRVVKWLSVAVLAVFAVGVFAAELPAGKVYTKAEYDVAYKLLDVMNTRSQMDTMRNGMLDMQLKAAPQLLPYKDVFAKFFAKYLNYENIKKEFADIYLDNFTPAEIKELTAFYMTPLGKKVIAKTPDITMRGAQIGQAAVMKHIAELQAELQKAIAAQQKKALPTPQK